MIPPLLSRTTQRQRYRSALPYLAGTVLDVGCGLAELADCVRHLDGYVGIDSHPGLLQLARQRHPQHHFYQLDLDCDPLPGELTLRRFETITMIAILEHLAHPQRSLERAAALLAPNGHLVATTPTPLGHRVHRAGAYVGLFYREAVDEHKTVLDGTALKRLFAAAGLRVVRYERFGFGCNQLIVGTRCA